VSSLLRCARTLGTNARIDEHAAEEGSRRLGILAILTAVTVVGKTLAGYLLQPEMAAAYSTPTFRLAALFLVLASAGLFWLQRSKSACPQMLLDLGLVFEVVGALALGIIENSLPWGDHPIRGSTGISVWIAICVLVIPNKPSKSIAAALASAAMAPLAHLLCAATIPYPHLPWNRLAEYTLTPLIIAGWTPFISARLYRMQEDLSRNAELGSYHLNELLGKGGMGEVWRASHRLLRRAAAIKLVRPDLLAKANATELRQMRQRFEQEAQAIAGLQSPHTVALYDFGASDDGSLFYAMELLDGMDLETIVDRHGPLPAGRVVSIVMQVCESLEEAHNRGMIHRDVKPTNIFLCRLGTQADFVKVLDFGLVKATIAADETRLTMAGETSGTPAFMSPEQVRGEDIDARADIYGLGCVAYFLLTGSLVFEERTAMAAALAHAEKTPVPPSERSELPIPPSLERVVMACLEKNRDRRPASVSDLACMLESCTDVPRWTRKNAREWWALHQPATAGAPA
jgi:serine/threonine-protein kinase